MRTFPGLLAGTGYVLPGKVSKAAAREQAAAWISQAFGLSPADAADEVDGAHVANDAWWSNETPKGGTGAAGFVMSPDYPGAQQVTVVHLPPLYVNDA